MQSNKKKVYGFHVVEKRNKGKLAWFAWRSIAGKMRWVYIGKDISLAAKKIEAWCLKYGLEKMLEETRVVERKDSIKSLEERVERLEMLVSRLSGGDKILGFRICQDSGGNHIAYRSHEGRKIKIGLGKSLEDASDKIQNYCARKAICLSPLGEILSLQ